MQRHCIRVFVFQPFESRQGQDTVIGLRFAFDVELIDQLKGALREARDGTGKRNPGGWLATERAWFVERSAWPTVRRRLVEAGYPLDGDPAAGNGDPSAEWSGCSRPMPPADWVSLVRQWYRQLCLDFHPGRGGSVEAMQAINEAHRRLQNLLRAS
jgi:hypothetical protein